MDRQEWMDFPNASLSLVRALKVALEHWGGWNLEQDKRRTCVIRKLKWKPDHEKDVRRMFEVWTLNQMFSPRELINTHDKHHGLAGRDVGRDGQAKDLETHSSFVWECVDVRHGWTWARRSWRGILKNSSGHGDEIRYVRGNDTGDHFLLVASHWNSHKQRLFLKVHLKHAFLSLV